jgi:hypothetical protein
MRKGLQGDTLTWTAVPAALGLCVVLAPAGLAPFLTLPSRDRGCVQAAGIGRARPGDHDAIAAPFCSLAGLAPASAVAGKAAAGGRAIVRNHKVNRP